MLHRPGGQRFILRSTDLVVLGLHIIRYTDLVDQYRQTWWTSTAGRTCSLPPSKFQVYITLHMLSFTLRSIWQQVYFTLQRLGGPRFILRSTNLVVIGLYYAPQTWWSQVYITLHQVNITLHRPGGYRFILRTTDLMTIGLYYAPQTWWSWVYITLYTDLPEGSAVSKKRGFLLLAIQL